MRWLVVLSAARGLPGGFNLGDEAIIREIYSSAGSVFEWGLGDSTHIAAEVGVKRYKGVDSSATWVDNVREKAPAHFELVHVNIGRLGAWGHPESKNATPSFAAYTMGPLTGELPFDVYLVDGRFRVAATAAAFLHASAGGKRCLVAVHDFFRRGIRKGHETTPRVLGTRAPVYARAYSAILGVASPVVVYDERIRRERGCASKHVFPRTHVCHKWRPQLAVFERNESVPDARLAALWFDYAIHEF